MTATVSLLGRFDGQPMHESIVIMNLSMFPPEGSVSVVRDEHDETVVFCS